MKKSITAAIAIPALVLGISFTCVTMSVADDFTISDTTPALIFNDTSTLGDNSEWVVRGRDEFFAIANSMDDVDVFRIEASEFIENAIVIDSIGRVGLGTPVPFDDLHIVDDNSPSIRLEQNNTAGFPGSTWVMRANHTGFGISNNGVPFLIVSGAPSASFTIDSVGRVGLGTYSPSASVHVVKDDAKILVENTGTTETRTLFEINNNGANRFLINNSDSGSSWAFLSSTNDEFRISDQNTGSAEVRVKPGGNVIIQGSLTQNSDRDNKMAIVPLDPAEILRKVAALPINQWQYKDTPGVNHVGPMAQDFYETFKLGSTPKGISSIDTAGVALAAIRALVDENRTLESSHRQILSAYHAQSDELELLKRKVSELEQHEQRIQLLEVMLTDLLEDQSASSGLNVR